MSPRPVTKWRLEEQDDGTVDVRQGRTRRRAAADLVDAISFTRRHLGDAHTVLHVDTDGYETDVTKSWFKRSR